MNLQVSANYGIKYPRSRAIYILGIHRGGATDNVPGVHLIAAAALPSIHRLRLKAAGIF